MPVSPEALKKGIDMMSGELKNAPEFDARKFATWAELLGDWSDEQYFAAVHQACISMTFFPTIGELRKGDKQASEINQNEAWELVRAAIRRHGKYASLTTADLNGDGYALWAIARMGAEAIGDMTNEDRAIKAAEFRRLYAVAKERGYTLDYLAGKHETDNRARGIDTTQNPALLGRSDIPAIAPSLEERGVVSLGGLS